MLTNTDSTTPIRRDRLKSLPYMEYRKNVVIGIMNATNKTSVSKVTLFFEFIPEANKIKIYKPFYL